MAALQAEFWDIPLNFPDKCDVVGASTKNRYKSVQNTHPLIACDVELLLTMSCRTMFAIAARD